MTDNAGLKGAAQIAAEQVASTKNVRIKPDILERLRSMVKGANPPAPYVFDQPAALLAMAKAADEIERLREYAKDWRDRAASKDVVEEKQVETIRNAALEEAAQVVESEGAYVSAEAIRALREHLEADSELPTAEDVRGILAGDSHD